MTVLVTSGAGDIGSHAVVEWLDSGYDILVVDNLSNSKKAINRVKELTGIVNSLMHFAGLKAVGESVEIRLTYYHNNFTGSLNLVRIMSENIVIRSVFRYSATVYGNP